MISVALATYNGEKYIKEQLESILYQTCPADEVIITDDCSKDGTVACIQAFIAQHDLTEKWLVYSNKTNLGFAENFRKAINLTKGDIIFFSDQDDIWVQDRIEKMSEVMQGCKDMGLLCTKEQLFTDAEKPEIKNGANSIPSKITLNPHTRFLRTLGCAMCVRRSFYDTIAKDWYDDWAHDEFFWSMAVLLGKAYQWDYTSIYHRVHSMQYSGHLGHTKEKRIRYLESVIKSSEYLLAYAKSNQLPQSTVDLFTKNVKAHQYRLELVKDRNLACLFKLVPYIKYYYAPKSYLAEIKIALRR